MKLNILIVLLFLHSTSSWAWGRRGHSIVCQTASYLAAQEAKGGFLKNHSFDLGYYCNVPDFIWKEPATYDLESFNHYMNLEVFDRSLRSKAEKAFELDRKTFDSSYPDVPKKAGRSWWRIRELNDQLLSTRDKLRGGSLGKETRHSFQADWLLYAGLVGHYVGDLSMPLHVTENHNGKLTHQEGVHAFYEDELVNDLFEGGDTQLEADVASSAATRWKKEKDVLSKKSVLELVKELSAESSHDAVGLLENDRKAGRNLKKAAKIQKSLIIKNLSAGSVYLAEFYRRSLGFEFDDEKFYNFLSSPKFIPPPNEMVK